MNFTAVLVSALIPLIFGMIWYHPKVAGNLWMQVNGFKREDMKPTNMAGKMILLYVFTVMVAMALMLMVIHQVHLGSLIANIPDPDGTMKGDVDMMLSKYGNNFRTFKHGAFHGFLAGIFLTIPIIGTSTMWENRGWKYVAIHAGYWIISMMLMGGVLSAWV